MSIFALVDCNNFYVSCERVFNPKLAGKPVVVLSNNDGCVVSRSNEAKEIGIGMGAPVFEISRIIEKHDVQIYSSNYALYGDMSQRVMNTLGRFTPKIEIYSIDEAFLDLSSFGYHNLTDYGQKIRATVKQWTGIPVAVGIAESKTLAKVAGRFAKKSDKTNGVLDLTASPYQEHALARTKVGDIWGIGRRYARLLKKYGIHNALQLRNTDDTFIREKMGVVGVRILHELRGTSCLELQHTLPAKKGITSSRSFKKNVETLQELRQAVAAYVSTGAEKLRREGSAAGALTVFINTNRFKDNYYSNSETLFLPVATSDTSELIHYAHRGLKKIYREGLGYKKAGVMFTNLVPEKHVQPSLFDDRNRKRSAKLMQTLDAVNEKTGTGTLRYAGAGLGDNLRWHTAFNKRSPAYTTQWEQLPAVS